jgi:hypothetical protein
MSPAIEDRLIIEAGWLSHISGSAYLHPRKTLSALTLMLRRHSSRLRSSTEPSCAMPALLTSTDRPPSVSRAAKTASFQSLSLVTS